MNAVLQSISLGILGFFLVYLVATFTLLAMSVREISWYARGQGPPRARPGETHLQSATLVAPAYNEQTLIVQSARAFLASDYEPLEVIVVDDGSKDETFARLDEAFDLVELPLRGRTDLKTAPIRSVHISRSEPRLRVVRKDNGGRSDAINAGISIARGELVVITDADSLLERDAIARGVRPFEVHPDSCMAVGGGVRVANGSTIVGGRVVAPGVGVQGIGATQVLEYMRGFLGTRIAWSEMNGLLIVSGAFGVFRRDLLVALGGFSRATLGEDMEMTMRIHHLVRPRLREAHVEFVPDAVCWTEAPGTMAGLRSQRTRWHAGLLDNLRMHWRMLGRVRFGAAGTLAMPYMVLFEALEPLVEVLGYAIVIALIVTNTANWTYLVAFFLVAVITGEVLNTTALLIEEIGFRRYRAKDLARMCAWGLVEALWFRPALAWWRLKATLLALIGRRPGWGSIPRGEAILERPVGAMGTLTR
ncbi:MAG: glycosyltransferase [Solirubrobacterales bacterium]|nr:glycosyltransferase [Solirubrobacterales bacterium]